VEAMIFDTTKPESWQDLSSHPQFEGKHFEREWYDGNLDEDLDLLRRACVTIVQSNPKFRPKLIVLDDCTFFANFTYNGDVICAIYPANTCNDERCLFFSFPKFPELEIRVLTVEKAAEVMLAFSRKEDLTAFEEIG
jgi:hypothetical protein